MITDWDDAYANGDYIADAATYPELWATQSAKFRDELSGDNRARLDIAYGNAPREKYDLFLPAGTPKGLVVFVHGGYWKAFDKSSWSHLANGAVTKGWAVCMPSYTLAPDARLSDITRQIGAAITHAADQIAGPLRITGHSAGGHLVSRMVSHTSPLSSSILARIENTVSISGLHDLRPLLRTSMNDTLGLDAAEAEHESAALLKPALSCSITCWVGADERPEFVRQNDLLANIWTGLGARTRSVHAPDKHHFNVIADLANPDSDLVACLLSPISAEDA
ncbi:MAG: alpha/beta hydrolase [Thalassospira sp.]|uniref:alpha/beta hydrolase n=1 Tax=unclassified Thalassospira TaxID=2648997 RepID=UPI000C6852CF|nr:MULTISPECIES: alpha/beta hydrolase [unclassified Thalassospira]MBE70580.1 alpha/beta hydrolase [Thalassospira sp.]QPO10771.1 alpha/beta hydrolase [Thalassospira sp. A40-3]|tara:strand:- start:531 stop:1367 length:837 start_codon:yes stop_codon:yes gene_type:complete